jgi:DNA-directed RNA polymerase specialized sigma24 family protein
LKQGLTCEEAEDAVEETFDRILTSITSNNEGICGGERWMWSICRRKVTDVFREKQKQALELFETYPSSEDTNPEIYFEKQERLQAVSSAWEKISEADREEIRRGRGRGPGRKAWHEAIQRLRTVISEE